MIGKSFSIFLLGILILSTHELRASSISVEGSVSGTWDVDTVRVTGDIDVEVGDSLFISPGVYVEFGGSFSFYIRGFVCAEGLGGEEIRFDAADTTGFSVDTISKGGWGGIQFYYNSYTADSSIFDYCIFRHGKAVSQDSIETHGGAMCLRDIDRLRISNSLFEENFARYNGGAIYLEESDVLIKDCKFLLNSCGPAVFPYGYGGALCADHSETMIIGCEFRHNSSTGVGGAVAVRFKDAVINNNIFTDNYSGLGGAIGFLHYYEYPNTHCNNLMLDNSAEFFGGAIANIDAGPSFVNNTIAYNSAPYGGAFYVKDSLVPNVYNTIMWLNWASVGSEVYLWDAFASANFYYCDIKGGSENFGGSGGTGYNGIYEENIDAEPLFEIPGFYFYPELGSPCHNAGTPDTSGLQLPPVDLGGGPRIDNVFERIEMGCYELWWVGTVEQDLKFTAELDVYPNPAFHELTIRYPESVDNCSILIMDGQARIFDNLSVTEASGLHKINVSEYMPGTYFVALKQNGIRIGSSKFIVK